MKVDQCAQYVDGIGIVAKNATELTRNIQAVFECICQARVNLEVEKIPFEFFGRAISSEGVPPQTPKIQNLLYKVDSPTQKLLCIATWVS